MHFSTLLTTTAMLLCLSLTAPAPSESSEQEPAADDAIPLLITATEVKNYTEGIFGYVSLIEGKGENQQSCNGSLYSVSPPPAGNIVHCFNQENSMNVTWESVDEDVFVSYFNGTVTRDFDLVKQNTDASCQDDDTCNFAFSVGNFSQS